MLTLSQVEAAEQLLCDGVPKLRVRRMLDISRSSVEKIAAGKHPLQSEPADFLDRYSRRPTWAAVEVVPHTHSLEMVERIEVLLCYHRRYRFSHHPMYRLPLSRIQAETGVSRRVIEHIARRVHPAQLERDGEPRRAYIQSPLLPRAGASHTKETVALAANLLADGDHSQKSVSMSLGMTPRTVRKINRSVHFQQLTPFGQDCRTRHMRPREHRSSAYLPSPRRILKLCVEIRRLWTPEERIARNPFSWTPQVANERLLFDVA